MLKVFPFARVSIDGQDIGEVSDSRILALPVGDHRVRLRHPHRSKTFPIKVRANRSTEIDFNAFKVE